MLRDEFNIATLIARFLSGSASEGEQSELQNWREAESANDELFQRLSDPKNRAELDRMASHYDKAQAWSRLNAKITPSRSLLWLKTAGIAAAFVVSIGLSVVFLYKGGEKAEQKTVSQSEKVVPGEAKALLTLADGSVVDLESAKQLELTEVDGTCITKDSSLLNYATSAEAQGTESVVYNKIMIPRGGEYTLKLSDGTIVYMNAMSSLRFPVHFKGNRREVELEGEAYFEVSKGQKPFIVKTHDLTVEVLGTVFNISSYTDDAMTRATLVEGSVRVTDNISGGKLLLKPSEQAAFDKETGTMSVGTVDIEQFTAWKSGYFYFKDWRLEDIMNHLARWYDINTFYQQNDIKNMRFGCNISRYGEIAPILKLLEQTNKITATLKGNTIVFSHK